MEQDLIDDCLVTIRDVLENRVRDLNGKVKKYDVRDRDIIIKIINEQKEVVALKKKDLSKETYDVIMQLYDSLLLKINERVI